MSRLKHPSNTHLSDPAGRLAKCEARDAVGMEQRATEQCFLAGDVHNMGAVNLTADMETSADRLKTGRRSSISNTNSTLLAGIARWSRSPRPVERTHNAEEMQIFCSRTS